jgi:hypothetical protein
MNIPTRVRRQPVVAYAVVPQGERGRHGYTDVKSKEREEVALYVVTVDRGTTFRVDGRIEPNTYWLFELDEVGKPVEDTPTWSLDEAIGFMPDLDWKRLASGAKVEAWASVLSPGA